MSDLPISVVITRAELTLADLELNDHTAYATVGFGPGRRIRRNTYNKSGNAHGGTLNNSVLDVIVRPLIIRVLATSQSQLNTRTQTLLQAVEQSSFTIVETVSGAATTYDCMTSDDSGPTDPAGGDTDLWDKFQLMKFRHAYRFAIPTQPQPLTGPI
jgi:hypothetical protein